jgi:SAM-dependent methyltransferase
MSATQADRYALERTAEENERLRLQARAWDPATGRAFDAIGLAAGASCVDAGCGPGETMRLMAERVGPAGRVLGLDVDDALGADAIKWLYGLGHRQCGFRRHDLTEDAPIPGAPFDLVYARFLLFHLPERVAVLERLWDAVAAGGHLVIQDYDVRTTSVTPALASVDEIRRVFSAAFDAVGADPQTGVRLPELFAQAGIGDPDGTDVAGRLDTLAAGRELLERVFRSVLPTALAHDITSDAEAAVTLAAFDRDVALYAERPFMWPTMVGAWKRKA